MPVAGNKRRRDPIWWPLHFDNPSTLELGIRREEQSARRNLRSRFVDPGDKSRRARSFPQFLHEILSPGMNGLEAVGNINIQRILIESALADVGGILQRIGRTGEVALLAQGIRELP